MTRPRAIHALGDAGRAVCRRSRFTVRERFVSADDLDRVTCKVCRKVLIERVALRGAGDRETLNVVDVVRPEHAR